MGDAHQVPEPLLRSESDELHFLGGQPSLRAGQEVGTDRAKRRGGHQCHVQRGRSVWWPHHGQVRECADALGLLPRRSLSSFSSFSFSLRLAPPEGRESFSPSFPTRPLPKVIWRVARCASAPGAARARLFVGGCPCCWLCSWMCSCRHSWLHSGLHGSALRPLHSFSFSTAIFSDVPMTVSRFKFK